MAKDMLDGFNHTQHKEEVEQRWGREAYAQGDAWWRELDAAGQSAWESKVAALNADWLDAYISGTSADSAAAQDLARHHVAWLSSIPATPASAPGRPARDYVLGLAEMYVADARFAANYGGAAGAGFVRDSLVLYAQREL